MPRQICFAEQNPCWFITHEFSFLHRVPPSRREQLLAIIKTWTNMSIHSSWLEHSWFTACFSFFFLNVPKHRKTSSDWRMHRFMAIAFCICRQAPFIMPVTGPHVMINYASSLVKRKYLREKRPNWSMFTNVHASFRHQSTSNTTYMLSRLWDIKSPPVLSWILFFSMILPYYSYAILVCGGS